MWMIQINGAPAAKAYQLIVEISLTLPYPERELVFRNNLNELVAVCQFLLSADGGKPIADAYHSSFPARNTINLTAMHMFGLSAISSCSWSPMDMDKPSHMSLSLRYCPANTKRGLH